ncbi:GUN4 domain-containing protein [Nostocaceae cyanobacterium CENA357]|uniref:GUN4 domain-containing protein n=1 Tax=Atlanticothrix silvestris CENA357 TaxID=1725252 RepID=A0A8J7HEN9_9CYAN|nr:GUN4 domain-containing protein [Atlanticothrix silvestris]MBH8551509.1 GUN4 domain-containing protein [Atlanticothrix silvestris CENA357]
MKIPIKQICREFYLLSNRLSLVEKLIYCSFGIVLIRSIYLTIINLWQTIITSILAKSQIIYAIFLGILIFGLGFYLYISRVKYKQNSLEESSLNDDINEPRNIYPEGNYNENININGDYIEIHGDVINIDQNFSEVAQEIRELITELQNQGYSEEDAKTEIATELAEEARKKPKVRKKLFMWKKSFSTNTKKTNDENEVAREVVTSATVYSHTSSKDFTEVVSGCYQKLDELLKARKWEEADLETAKIIYVISHKELPENSPYKTYLTNSFGSEYIKVLPRKDLNNINKLWLKYSNGRFGFSAQKRIWKRLGDGSDTTYNRYEIQKKFGDEVGWRKEGNWLYYSDIYYWRTAQSGHLPILLMLRSGKSERCHIDFEILKVLVERI